MELQHKLMEAQGKLDKLQVRTYAQSARCAKDVDNLSKVGLTPEQISYTLDLPLQLVRSHKAKIERQREERRKFLATGLLPWTQSEGGYFAILQR